MRAAAAFCPENTRLTRATVARCAVSISAFAFETHVLGHEAAEDHSSAPSQQSHTPSFTRDANTTFGLCGRHAQVNGAFGQAPVSGSSEPSMQSQKSSLRFESGSVSLPPSQTNDADDERTTAARTSTHERESAMRPTAGGGGAMRWRLFNHSGYTTSQPLTPNQRLQSYPTIKEAGSLSLP